MAISVNTIWEVRTAGADTQGGGFVSGASGTDYSQQDTKNSGGNNGSTTDAVANGTTTITSATASFTSAIVGNIIRLNGGTGSLAAGWYEVKTFTNSTTIVVDRTVATGTGITMNIGGALASISQLFTNMALGHQAYIKSGTYTFTSSVTITTNFVGGSTTAHLAGVNGYGSTRGDNGARPLITTSTNSVDLFTLNGAEGIQWNHLSFSNTATTRDRGFNVSGASYYQVFTDCVFDGFTIAFRGNWNSQDTCRNLVFIGCEIKNCTDSTAAVQNTDGCTMLYCYLHGNTGAGVNRPFNSGFIMGEIYRHTVFASNGADGINITAGAANTSAYMIDVDHCAFYSNTGSGILQGDTTIPIMVQNTIFDSNTRYGWEVTTANSNNPPFCAVNQYNAYNNNTLGARLNVTAGTGDVTLTGSPFNTPGSGDFSLNSTSGAGAACKAAGFPGATVFIGTGSSDIGPLQSSGGGGGGSTTIVVNAIRTIFTNTEDQL